MQTVFDISIDARRRVQFPKEAIAQLSWESEVIGGAAATIELTEEGAARILQGHYYHPAMKDAGDEASELGMLLYPASWETGLRLTLPRPVAVHILNNGEIKGGVFVRMSVDCIELWSNQQRLKAHEARRSNLAHLLPP